jgi:hypothetical protein
VGHDGSCVPSSVENEGDVVDVAVTPVLARFGGSDDGVADIACVCRGVLTR